MHGGHSPEPLNGGHYGQLRPEDMLKAEIAKITDKGGLVDFEGVEKIIQLMQPESGDKKVDLASRIRLVNVISLTDSFDCLSRFVHLRGLLILDEWLQEFHKGKIGDSSPKEGDLSVEEFLFALLCALDKLPVNIHALQTCNVGKSVNHLRSHKNPEILKKARTLVDTWKKSVEAEMNMIERKRAEQMNVIETRSNTRLGGSGSWSNKSMSPEVSPHMPKQIKISISQPSVVKGQGKHNSDEAIAKLSKSPSPSVPAGIAPSDVPPVTAKQEKSSSSSPSASVKGSPISATPERTTDASLSENIRNNNVVAMDMDSCKEKEGLVGCNDDDEASKGADSASGGTLKSGKSHEASYSSINALVESCAKFSEVNMSAPAGNDVGMNLLANVAAGEISRSDISPSCSPENKQALHEDTIEDGCQREDYLKVSNEHARLAENSNDVPMVTEVGPTQLASDVGTRGKVETHVNDESSSQSSTYKQEYEKKLVQKEHDDEDSELLTSSSAHASLEQKAEQFEEKANTDPDSSVLLQTSENEAQEGDGSGPPDSTSALVSETAVKMDFDLNEVVPGDEVEMHSSSSLVVENQPVSITIAAAAKGPFLSSENLLKSKPELGWKGSAATSAFRPAEPRKAREFLDFDLNVGVDDDVTQNNPSSKYLDSRNSKGGLDLDLNACEQSPDVGPFSFSRPTIPQIHPRSLSGGFDLNNGPGIEENGIQFLPNVPVVGMGNFHSWFPPSSTYPAIPIPAQSYSMPQRMLTPMAAGGAATGAPFNPELFRGPVLSSSPAVAFSSTTPFQFPGFPFETNFSIAPNTVPTAYMSSSGGPGPGPLCFPTIPSQLVGPLSSTYRSYVMSLPGGSSNIGPDNKKWGTHGLDLNSGPGGPDETLPSSGFRQLPLPEEQLKMFQQMAAASGGSGGGVFKRKEPVDGWDGGDRVSYKHPSWQ